MPAPLANLRDAHLHLAEHGEELSCVHLDRCRSRAECLELLAQAARSRPRLSPGAAQGAEPSPWIIAVGARPAAWSEPSASGAHHSPWPSAREIDEATGGRPAIVRGFDHHALVAGGAALALAGVTRHTPDPAHGVIERDPSTREPTGLLLEDAGRLVREVMPKPTRAEQHRFVRAALADLSRLGFVEAHDMMATPELASILLELERAGDLPLSIALYATREHFERLARQAAQWESERVRLGGLKLFTDGTLNSRTALMLGPFADPIPGLARGKAMMSPSEIEESIRFADSRGFPIAAHAIGDGAVRAVLDAIERIRPRAGGQRIEHAQFVHPADVPRFARLNVIASLQPCHLLTDIEAIRRSTPDREARAFPVRDLIESARSAGRVPEELVWFGSDTPIVPPDPADNLQAAVERRRAGMPASQAIAPEQAIDRDIALACMRSPAQA